MRLSTRVGIIEHNEREKIKEENLIITQLIRWKRPIEDHRECDESDMIET